MLAIEVRNVWKKFDISVMPSLWELMPKLWGSRDGHGSENGKGTFWALKDVSFTVDKGGVMGLLGRNGAGKTTLLSLLCGATSATRGTATVIGRVAPLIAVGAGFQPELTGRENIFLNSAILGMSRREVKEKFDAIVEFSELERFLETPVKKYSSGMIVRLGFAIAAHLEPDVLLVDEVLSVGDVGFQRKCLKRIDAMRQRGVTLIVSSHNTSMIRGIADKCMILEQGTVLAIGDPDEVIAQYEEEASTRSAV